MKIEISAAKREAQGTGASRRLRRAGRVPGIVYGGRESAVMIELDHNELFQGLRKEAFHASILTLNLDGQKHQVLLRAVNMHPFKAQVQHIDFQRVRADEKIHMKVPLHFVGAEVSPAVKVAAAIVSHVLSELDISCLPADLPEFIEVDLSGIELGDTIHVRDLTLPKGVEPVLSRDENPVVATTSVPKEITVEEEAAAAEAAVPASQVPAGKQLEVPAEPAAEPKKGEKAEKGEKK
jgi:large subunit ribosomal protein L25